jgi:hypothetical protein
LQPYPVVAADALLEIGTAVISAVLSFDEPLLVPVGALLSYFVLPDKDTHC